MELDTVIETQRLYLRELIIEDAPFLSLVLSDKESMKYYPAAFTMEEVINWIERNRVRYEKDGFGLWAVIRKSDNQFLGDCGITLQNIDGEILPEIGFHIIRSYCNNGYATEAAEACKSYAMEKLKFKSIYSYSEKGNKPSQRVSEKIGMKKLKDYRNGDKELVVYEYIENLNSLMLHQKC